MLRLIKADFPSTGKPHLRNGTPSCFLNLRALNVLLREGCHFGLQVVAHEIDFLGATPIGWVYCGFSGGQGEDQPAMTRIDGFETEDIAEKCAVRLGVLTVENYVSAKNHLFLLNGPVCSAGVATRCKRFPLLPNKEDFPRDPRHRTIVRPRGAPRCRLPAHRELPRATDSSALGRDRIPPLESLP